MKGLRADVFEQLRYEGLFTARRGLTIALIPARFHPEVKHGWLYAARMYPLQGRIFSLERVLGAKAFEGRPEWKGFGSSSL